VFKDMAARGKTSVDWFFGFTAIRHQIHHKYTKLEGKIERINLKMAAAYSVDLRTKILSAWQNKEGTQRELAE